jgi:hypothetical protein
MEPEEKMFNSPELAAKYINQPYATRPDHPRDLI